MEHVFAKPAHRGHLVRVNRVDDASCTQEDGPYACCKACQEGQEASAPAEKQEASAPAEKQEAEASEETPSQPEQP